jgi:hypothetical protein
MLSLEIDRLTGLLAIEEDLLLALIDDTQSWSKELNSLRFTFIRRRNCPPAGKVGVPSRPLLRINLPGQPTSRLSVG